MDPEDHDRPGDDAPTPDRDGAATADREDGREAQRGDAAIDDVGDAPARVHVRAIDDHDEAYWARILFDLRYGDAFSCRACGHGRASQLRKRPRVFSCQACGEHHSVTAGTPLHGCKVPLAKVARAAELLATGASVSARALADLLDVSVETAWTLGHRLRAGLAATRPRLDADRVMVTELAVRMRDVCRAYPKDNPVHPVIIVATDAEFRAAADVTTDRWFAPTHLVRSCSAQRELDGWAHGHVVAQWIGSVLELTHGTVSSRWLANYVGALAAIQTMAVNREERRHATLRAVVRRPARGIGSITPPRYKWHPSYQPYVGKLNPVRLPWVELPLHRSQRVPLRRGHINPSPTPDRR